jgi:propionyl-CoA carboxylase alpha chain
MMKPIRKILIANRGEIAIRIMRACRDMNITSVAVFSDIDRHSSFVAHADEAWALGGITSRESYLDAAKIIQTASCCGADAIHPGYGFLSENAAFAEAVVQAGLIFIGPPAESIRMMGSKTAARRLMSRHGIPTVPGTLEPIHDLSEARRIAAEIGYPILLKAAAGGGGKGMRLVEEEQALAGSLESAAREAQAGFGDAAVYMEKFVEEPRHIEFQILADSRGHTIHLGERECTIQRRHQKIIEEAPSCLLDAELRKKMGRAAVLAAQACGYINAGTIEFLVDKRRDFYFLEMNTRLQVEHPVTELVTGLDLVREQILISQGAGMTLDTDVECFWGHALECRIYAENPEDNFAPAPGKITFLKPPDGPGIREDSGVAPGSEISLYYDPLVSKLISWGSNREQAIQRMLRALREYEIGGLQTNIPFLQQALKHRAFREGKFTTKFIDENFSGLFSEDEQQAGVAALSAVLMQFQEKTKFSRNGSAGKNSGVKPIWKTIHRQRNLRVK